jgi:hypothetical protein
MSSEGGLSAIASRLTSMSFQGPNAIDRPEQLQLHETFSTIGAAIEMLSFLQVRKDMVNCFSTGAMMVAWFIHVPRATSSSCSKGELTLKTSLGRQTSNI